MKKCRFLFYRDLQHQDLLAEMISMIESYDDKIKTMPNLFSCASQLIELAVANGFQGNIWHCFLVYNMMTHENAYTLSCEGMNHIEDSIYHLAQLDFKSFKCLFEFDITLLDKVEDTNIWSQLCNFHNVSGGNILHQGIREQLVSLAQRLSEAQTIADFQQIMTMFYQVYGVGMFGLNKAFRLQELSKHPALVPIRNVEQIGFSGLVGYERQKQKLIVNTESFIQGKAANNVLLYGDAGTGKSSSIKAILNQYYDQGLRMIEIYKHQFRSLSNILELIKDRNYKFIIYMDDLSFEDDELEYKFLKAVIEGGIGKKPDNVLIYATSNRRHLIREKFSDKKALEDELHGNDTVQEKLSLAARFGISIYFGSPDKYEFEEIVETLADQSGIKMSKEELLQAANQWELSHGGRSGRTAAQFITHLLGIDEAE